MSSNPFQLQLKPRLCSAFHAPAQNTSSIQQCGCCERSSPFLSRVPNSVDGFGAEQEAEWTGVLIKRDRHVQTHIPSHKPHVHIPSRSSHPASPSCPPLPLPSVPRCPWEDTNPGRAQPIISWDAQAPGYSLSPLQQPTVNTREQNTGPALLVLQDMLAQRRM